MCTDVCVDGVGRTCQCSASYPSLLLVIFTEVGLLLLILIWPAIKICVGIHTLIYIYSYHNAEETQLSSFSGCLQNSEVTLLLKFFSVNCELVRLSQFSKLPLCLIT